MKRLLSGLCAGLMSIAMGVTSVVPSVAAPVQMERPSSSTSIEQVRDHHDRRRPPQWGHHRPRPSGDWNNGHRPRPPHGWNNGHRPRPPHYSGNYRPRPGYWNGHRGSNYYRNGYRRHNDGWWYPLAAFGTGIIIGGAINNSQPTYRPVPAYGNSHVSWCANRYRSYRAYDNTFQPYNGPRQQCYSPYR